MASEMSCELPGPGSNNLMHAMFISFEEPDGGHVGTLVLVNDSGDGNVDEMFWATIAHVAAEEDWWYGTPSSAQFDNVPLNSIWNSWYSYVQEQIVAPVWHWYRWREESSDDSKFLDQADKNDKDAFRAAEVMWR